LHSRGNRTGLEEYHYITSEEKPILWFSKNQEYERTTYRINDYEQPFTVKEHIELFGSFVRFGIPLNVGLELFPWEGGKLADEARIPPDKRTTLEETALKILIQTIPLDSISWRNLVF
jgi:hypothetical protein